MLAHHQLLLLLLLFVLHYSSAFRVRHQQELFHRPPPIRISDVLQDSPRFRVSFSNPAAAIQVTNSSSLSVYHQPPAEDSYVLSKSRGLGDEQPLYQQLQKPYQQSQQPYQQLHDPYQSYQKQQPQRTWTARPRLDFDDVTTRDPAIPDNPEGLKNPSLLVGPWEEEPTIRVTNAVFRGVNGSVVNVQAGTTANLPCVIINRADHETVSWIRLRDHHIITVGRQTYSKDDRFSLTYNRHLNEWRLHLRYAQARDAGQYVCQLSTHPPMVFISTLSITEASAEIPGGAERYVEEGSSVVLNCTLRHHTQPPLYVFWYHNRTMINFDTNRQVSVHKTKDGSVLTLEGVVRSHSGNYTCVPANAIPASITLHIIDGEAPAAMQVSGGSERRAKWLLMLLLTLVSPFCHHLS